MKRLKFLVLSATALLIVGCNEEFIKTSGVITDVEKPLLQVSYNMITTRDFEQDVSGISNIDLSLLNPANQKEKVDMQLFEDGQMNITIEVKDFEQKIKSPHKILPDDTPNIVKTIIEGNSISFYDENGSLMGKEQVPASNNLNLVQGIKDIGKDFSTEDINETIATMQGHQFIGNLEDFIKNLARDDTREKGVVNEMTIVEQGDNYVTLRVPLSNIEAGMNEEAVLLIDKTLNKIVGSRIYDSTNTLLMSNFFGYSTGEVKSLNAIKTIEKVQLISGESVDLVSYTKIDDLEFNLNL